MNLFDPSFNFLSSVYPNGPVGQELPDFVNGVTAFSDTLVDTVRQLGEKLQNQDINWQAIVGASTELRNAATTYFNSASGATNTALTRIFRPNRVYEYGCFNSYWTG